MTSPEHLTEPGLRIRPSFETVAAATLTAALLLIYLPDIGHGFIRDDFMWVRSAGRSSLGGIARVFAENTGFYRPLVTLTFVVDRRLFGLRPFAYGLTNLAILCLCAGLLVRLARLLGLGSRGAVATAALWAFNFHGVNMALLWISGRTALLLCLFSLLAALATLRQHWWRAGAWTLLAMLSKEEAVLLGPLLAWWTWYTASAQRRSMATLFGRTGPLWLALVVYGLLRVNSGAFGPATAPSYYQFTSGAPIVARNLLEYADRAATFSALAVVLAVAITRSRPHWSARDATIATFAGAWLATFFALTLFLPVRSSLYALCPSIGVALMGALAIERLAEAATRERRRALTGLLVVPFLLLPVYRQRNERWTAPADAARVLTADLNRLTPAIPAGATLLAIDSPDRRLEDVFSGLFADAVTLYVGNGVRGELVPSDSEPRSGPASATQLWLGDDGHLTTAGDPPPRQPSPGQ